MNRADWQVAEPVRAAAIDAVIAAMDAGELFAPACQVVADELEVAYSTVAYWVNRSGRRNRSVQEQLRALRTELATSRALNTALHRQLNQVSEQR